MKNNYQPSYGSGIRSMVFETIVRQALAGAPWRDICAGPMLVNGIKPEEIEDELRKRGGNNDPPTACIPRKPIPPDRAGSNALPQPRDEESLDH